MVEPLANNPQLEGSNPTTYGTNAQFYKPFYICNLLMFVLN
jgi:hypothetical protein